MVRDIMGLMEIISLLFILAAVYNEKFKYMHRYRRNNY